MRSALSILGIILAGSIFFMYTKPTYDEIQTTQAHIVQYDAALAKANKLQELKQTLLSRYNAFNPVDLARLQVMLPDQVNNIGLILDLDTLSNQFGMSLENVNISSSADTSTAPGDRASTVSTIGASIQPYRSLDVQFTVHGTYTQFIQYITSLEASLRLVDLVGLSVTAGGSAGASPRPTGSGVEGSDNIVYSYSVTLRTYWLK